MRRLALLQRLRTRGFFTRAGRASATFFAGLALVVILVAAPPERACAQDCDNCECIEDGRDDLIALLNWELNFSRAWVGGHMAWLRDMFMREYFWPEHVQRSMRLMSDQLTNTAMMEMMIIGQMFDAKHELETQRLFQERAAQAHKDYRPTAEMCGFATITQNLEQAGRDDSLVSHIMQQRSQRRQLHNMNVSGARNREQDTKERLENFRRRFCNIRDNGHVNGNAMTGLQPLCRNSASSTTVNKDVDYGRSVYAKMVLPEFKFAAQTDDERSVWALNQYLFAHDTFDTIPRAFWERAENQDEVLDIRSIVAKRSVAEYSFQTIVGLRGEHNIENANGTSYTGMGPYIRQILNRQGMAGEANDILPAEGSYYSTMYALTKAIYQDPQFYVGLYDSPANLQRKGIVMRAIDLMQGMDMLRSGLRNEMMLAVLVEMEIIKAQRNVQDKLDRATGVGEGKGR